jgi:hypothetical protein
VNAIAFAEIARRNNISDEDIGKFIGKLKECGAISNKGFLLPERLSKEEAKFKKICDEYNKKMGIEELTIANVPVDKGIYPFGRITRQEKLKIDQEGAALYKSTSDICKKLENNEAIDNCVPVPLTDEGVVVTRENFFSVVESSLCKIAAVMKTKNAVKEIKKMMDCIRANNMSGKCPITLYNGKLYFGNIKNIDRTVAAPSLERQAEKERDEKAKGPVKVSSNRLAQNANTPPAQSDEDTPPLPTKGPVVPNRQQFRADSKRPNRGGPGGPGF